MRKYILYLILLIAYVGNAAGYSYEGGIGNLAMSACLAEVAADPTSSYATFTDPIFINSTQGTPIPNPYTSNIALAMQNMGQWITDPASGYIYKIIYIEAASNIQTISVHFNNFNLPAETDLYVLNDSMNFHPFTITNAFNNTENQLLLANISGNAVAFLCVTTASNTGSVMLDVDYITYSTTPVQNTRANNVPFPFVSEFGEACSSFINVNCTSPSSIFRQSFDVSTLSRSVIKFNAYEGKTQQWYSCSGVLMNQLVSDNNVQPYFLTAQHCITDNTDLSNLYIFFNYQSPDCNDADVPTASNINGTNTDGNRYYMQTPVTLIDQNVLTDQALLLINNPIPPRFFPYYAGWSTSFLAPESIIDGAYTIGHPEGDIKKVSKANGVIDPTPNYACQLVTSVIDEFLGWLGVKKFKTQSICTVIDEPYYQVPGYSHGGTQPGSSGSPLFDGTTQSVVATLSFGSGPCAGPQMDGYGKFHDSWVNSYSLRNALNPNNAAVNAFGGVSGRQISCYTSLELEGAMYYPLNDYYAYDEAMWLAAQTTITAPSNNQRLEILQNAAFGFQAGNKISLLPGFRADPGCFFAAQIGGCGINGSPGNSLYAYGIRQGVKTINNNLPNNIAITPAPQNNVTIYPNPTTGQLSIDFSYLQSQPVELTVVDLLGKQVYSEKMGAIQTGHAEVNLSAEPAGMYIVKVTSGNTSSSQKIILSK